MVYLLIGLLDIGLIVGETTSHDTTHDQVERLRPCPVFLKVVELERTVGRDTIEVTLIYILYVEI